MKRVKLYLDDIRVAPEGWVQAYSAGEAIEILENCDVVQLSLDHDLGDEDEFGTGYDVLLWLENKVYLDDMKAPMDIKVHSANVSARMKMESAIISINNK